MKHCLLTCLSAFLCCILWANHPTNSPDLKTAYFLDDNKRYLALMLVNESEESDETGTIQTAHDLGFNAVYLTVRWDAIKCHNAACMATSDPSGNTVDPNWNTSNRYWNQVDQQITKAKQLGMKIALRIHLGSADLRPTMAFAKRSAYLWGDNNYQQKADGSIDMGGYNFRIWSFSKQTAIDAAKGFIGEVLNRYGYLEGENNLLFVSLSTTTSQEIEYIAGTDYSQAAKDAYNSWYQTKYGTNAPNYPQEYTSTEGKKWYTFKHRQLRGFIDQVSTQISNYNTNIKFINDYGSAFDPLSANRGTLGFKNLGVNTDGIKVNDDYNYDHRFSMDILRSNFPGRWIMNETLLNTSIGYTQIYDFMNQSFAHGAKIFSVVAGTSSMSHFSSQLSQIATQWVTGTAGNMSTLNVNGTVSYTFDEILRANFDGNRFSTNTRNIYQEWLNQYNSNPANGKPVNVLLNDDELGDCTPPGAPIISATLSTVTQGTSTTLSASPCTNGIITWSHDLGTGPSKEVTPNETTTYLATCTVNGCTSSPASKIITVNPPTGGTGCVVNKVKLQFRASGDCCMDRLPGAKIQGSNNGTNWTDLYTFNMNGTGSMQEFTFPNTTAYSSVRFVASATGWGELHELEFYNGTTKLSGTAFGTDNYSLAFDGNATTQWHAPTTPGPNNYAGLNLTGCTPTNCDFNVTASAQSSNVYTQDPITLNYNCTGADCGGATFAWSGQGISGNESPKTITAPATAGNYTYTMTATKSGCTTKTANVNVTVNPTSGGGGCVVNKVKLQFRAVGDCCMDRLPGAKIQGSNNGSSWTDLYTFTTNGNGSMQEFTIPNTTAYSSVRFVASNTGWGELHELEFYNGTTKLSGTAFGTDNYSLAFDGNATTQWHAPTTPGPNNYAGLNLTGCTPTNCDFNVTASAQSTTVYTQDPITLNYNCTGADCSGATFAWSGQGISGNQSPKTITAPATAGNYTYTMTATKSGCTNKTANVNVTVNAPSGSGCIVNKVKLQFRQTGECCMDRLVGAKIQGSNDGTTWVDLYTFTTNGSGSLQEFPISNTTAYSSVRFQASSTGWGELYELEFYKGTAKLTGTPFGIGNYANAFDGNFSTDWQVSSNPGTGNYAGLSNLGNCSGSAAMLDMTDQEAINNQLQLLVSPNPSNGILNAGFYLPRGEKGTIVINDLQGRTIYRQAVTGNGQHNEKIYLANKSSGTFILRLETPTGVEVKKITITR